MGNYSSRIVYGLVLCRMIRGLNNNVIILAGLMIMYILPKRSLAVTLKALLLLNYWTFRHLRLAVNIIHSDDIIGRQLEH